MPPIPSCKKGRSSMSHARDATCAVLAALSDAELSARCREAPATADASAAKPSKPFKHTIPSQTGAGLEPKRFNPGETTAAATTAQPPNRSASQGDDTWTERQRETERDRESQSQSQSQSLRRMHCFLNLTF